VLRTLSSSRDRDEIARRFQFVSDYALALWSTYKYTPKNDIPELARGLLAGLEDALSAAKQTAMEVQP
jgi:hypothetical protein